MGDANGGAVVISRGGGVEGNRSGGPGWGLQRVGATVPESNIMLRRDVTENCLAALGTSPFLVKSGGPASREAFRQLLTASIEPLERQVAHELSAKLERQIAIRFDYLAAVDIAARTRAYGTLRDRELPDAEARRLAGVSAAWWPEPCQTNSGYRSSAACP